MSKQTESDTMVCGTRVQVDHSGGHGHCWRDATADDMPANVRAEIEGEMIDGKRDACADFVASNGLHYRW